VFLVFSFPLSLLAVVKAVKTPKPNYLKCCRFVFLYLEYRRDSPIVPDMEKKV